MMNNTAGQPLNPEVRGDCSSLLVSGVLWLWITFIITLRLAVEIFYSILAPDNAGSRLSFLPILESIVILIPALLLALLWKHPYYKAAFRTWAWAAVYILIQLPMRYTSITALQSQVLICILSSIVFCLLLWFLLGRSGRNARISWQKPRTGAGLAIVLLIVGTVAWPWLAWGALGSLTDTILQLINGLLFGLAAAILVEKGYNLYTQNTPEGSTNNRGWSGLVIATTLAILATGLGFNFGVIQLLLILVLAPLGWIWAYLRFSKTGSTTTKPVLANLSFAFLLIGLVVAFPLMFLDPNELALIIGMAWGEILQWAVLAALVSALIGIFWIVFLAIYVHRNEKTDSSNQLVLSEKSKMPWIIAASIIWIVGLAIYFISGQPGFYGDDIFITFASKPDLSSATGISDYAQRRTFVYQALVSSAEQSQQSIRQFLDRWHFSYQPYYLVNGIEVSNNPLLRIWLARQPGISQSVDSPHMRPLPRPLPVSTGRAKPPPAPDWNLTMIGADRVWNELNITGKGVLVGQSDSGVQWDHPELRDNYRGKDGQNDFNWFDPWNATKEPIDQNGHGTHTLGSILGKHTGVAPDATWIGCANLDRNQGNPAYYLDCMQFMLAPYPQGGDAFKDGRPDLGAMVLNNSWGCPKSEGCQPDTLLEAADALKQAGVFAVVSAGNDGPSCSSVKDPLALYSQVLSVGAVDRSGELTFFSSRGPVTADGSNRVKPDLVAPGMNVLSSFPGNTYAIESGTSMAGPHVVGVVALMWSANPRLIGKIDETEQILTQTAKKYQGTLPNCPGATDLPSNATGYGIVDAYAAVKAALSAP